MSHAFYHLQSLSLPSSPIYQCLTDPTSLATQPKPHGQSPAISSDRALWTLLPDKAWPWHSPLFPFYILGSWALLKKNQDLALSHWNSWFPIANGFQGIPPSFHLALVRSLTQSSWWLILTKCETWSMVNRFAKQSWRYWIKHEKKKG